MALNTLVQVLMVVGLGTRLGLLFGKSWQKGQGRALEAASAKSSDAVMLLGSCLKIWERVTDQVDDVGRRRSHDSK